MKRLSSHKEVNTYLNALLKQGNWNLKPTPGRPKHRKIVHKSGRSVPIPFSPSCHHALHNLKRLIETIEDLEHETQNP